MKKDRRGAREQKKRQRVFSHGKNEWGNAQEDREKNN